MNTNYYFEHLNKEEQKVYYAIKEGLVTLQEEIQVPMLDVRTIAEIFRKVRFDCPEIFYTSTYSYRYQQGATYMTMYPVYLFEKSKIKEHIQAMDARIKKLVRQAESMSDKERELFIHDFLVSNVKYDKLKKEYSHEIIGALGNGVAVCEGISKAVKVLCDKLNIWCIIVMSDNNPDKGIKYRHTWNIVRIDGKYYHLDVTFDNTITKEGTIRYDYFNLSDSRVFTDHEPIMWKAPQCVDGDHFYYKEKKLSWTTLEEVRNRVNQAAKKNRELVFHWRGNHIHGAYAEILLIIGEIAKEKGKNYCLSVNKPQSVFKLWFVNDKDGYIEVEEANEGEKWNEEGC